MTETLDTVDATTTTATQPQVLLIDDDTLHPHLPWDEQLEASTLNSVPPHPP